MNTNQCVAIIDSAGNIEWANAAFHEYCAFDVGQQEQMSVFEIPTFANAFWTKDARDSLAKACEFCMTRVVAPATDNSRVVNVEMVPFSHDNTGTQRFTFSYFEKSLSQSPTPCGRSFADKTILASQFSRKIQIPEM